MLDILGKLLSAFNSLLGVVNNKSKIGDLKKVFIGLLNKYLMYSIFFLSLSVFSAKNILDNNNLRDDFINFYHRVVPLVKNNPKKSFFMVICFCMFLITFGVSISSIKRERKRVSEEIKRKEQELLNEVVLEEEKIKKQKSKKFEEKFLSKDMNVKNLDC